MRVTLEAYPTLTRELSIKIGFSSDKIMFSYAEKEKVKQLEATPADASTSQTTVYQLSDPDFMWHPDTYNLIVNYSCSINAPSHLFGQNGLAAKNGGVLGVALMWMAPDSGIRGSVEIGELNAKCRAPVKLERQVEFPPGELRGTLTLRTVLFLKEKGERIGKEKFRASHSGTVLGTLEDAKVIIAGEGSIFPIQEESRPGKPLWRVTCDWEDPNEDEFTYENFCLILNTAHKDYKNLISEDGLKNSPLLLEIACSAILILVTRVLSNSSSSKEVLTNRDNFKQGSISSVVSYLVNTYHWNVDDIEMLSFNIRETVMEKL